MYEHIVEGTNSNELLAEIMTDVTGDLLKDLQSRQFADAYGVCLSVTGGVEEISYNLYVSSNREDFDALKRKIEAKLQGYTPICAWFIISDRVKEELDKEGNTDPDIVWYLLHDANRRYVINENVIEDNLELYQRSNGK